jgi:gamma-glutamylcyclotransferase (GGCT)/AIG2-like uncharacterized protein YtfP
MNAECRLVAYGTLASGRPNHHQLDGLNGRWLGGRVRGALVQQGWGAALGYPALILDPEGPAVEVQIFESTDLPSHWPRLDVSSGDLGWSPVDAGRYLSIPLSSFLTVDHIELAFTSTGVLSERSAAGPRTRAGAAADHH